MRKWAVGHHHRLVNGIPSDTPAPERFTLMSLENVFGCLLYQGSLHRNGYGQFHADGKNYTAHTYAWVLANGPVPKGLEICHGCDVNYPPGDITYRRCVNVSHMHLAPHRENVAEAVAKGRQAVGERTAFRKHPELVPRGERSHWAKLTEEDVLAILPRIAKGERDAVIAPDFGVTRMTISFIRNNITWKHIPRSTPLEPTGRSSG